jgi:hypothetical protein
MTEDARNKATRSARLSLFQQGGPIVSGTALSLQGIEDTWRHLTLSGMRLLPCDLGNTTMLSKPAGDAIKLLLSVISA